MTSTINNISATTVVNGDEVTLTIGDRELKLEADEITSVVTALLAGRKQAISNRRDVKRLERSKAKAEREAKAKERKAAATKRNAERVAKLKAQLAKAEAKAKKAA
jgi:hypothetical protein